MTLAFLLIIAIVLMIVVSGAYIFVFGCVRRKELPWLVENEIAKTPYGKYSGHIRDANAWLQNHNAQDIWVDSYDGLKLHGVWIPVDNPKGTILLSHGYRSCPLLDFGLAFSFYHDLGWNLLVPDQRAHGKSGGRFITFGVKESKDVQTWIAYHNRCFGQYTLFLSGLSMGASTVLYLADRELPVNVKGIVADCGFTSPRDILSSVFYDVTHLAAFPSIIITGICARCFAGFGLRECDTRKSLSVSKVPVAIIHGKDDGFVPCVMSIQAYNACSGPKQILLVDDADHGVSLLVQPEKYIKFVTDFLKKNLD